MSKKRSKENVIANKKRSIRKLNNYLEGLISSDDTLKKADLISYWINDYVNMISFEEKFSPTKNIAYKRGDVIKVAFGFNVGSEFGGLHYAVVIDNVNDHSSPVITVVPLTSKTNPKPMHHKNVDLGNDLYINLIRKYKLLSDELDSRLNERYIYIQTLDVLLTEAEKATSKTDPRYLDSLELLERIKKEYQEDINRRDHLEQIKNEIDNMKTGSIALLTQITTISKIRIVDPKNTSGILANVSLSKESMQKINDKLLELYVRK